jgi:hypothetical protein
VVVPPPLAGFYRRGGTEDRSKFNRVRDYLLPMVVLDDGLLFRSGFQCPSNHASVHRTVLRMCASPQLYSRLSNSYAVGHTTTMLWLVASPTGRSADVNQDRPAPLGGRRNEVLDVDVADQVSSRCS